jgi:hypothetical protein
MTDHYKMQIIDDTFLLATVQYFFRTINVYGISFRTNPVVLFLEVAQQTEHTNHLRSFKVSNNIKIRNSKLTSVCLNLGSNFDFRQLSRSCIFISFRYLQH